MRKLGIRGKKLYLIGLIELEKLRNFYFWNEIETGYGDLIQFIL